MCIRMLLPFLSISFDLAWGIAAVMILFPDQVAAIFGELSASNLRELDDSGFELRVVWAYPF